jgi:hypothetical protein
VAEHVPQSTMARGVRGEWLNHGLTHLQINVVCPLPNAIPFRPEGIPYVSHINYIFSAYHYGPLAGSFLHFVRAFSLVAPSVVASNRPVRAVGVRGHNDGPALGPQVGFLDNGRGVGSDNTANGHEEAGGDISAIAPTHRWMRRGRHTRMSPRNPACTALVSS